MEQKLNLLVYGEAGVGKTTLVSQANDHPAMSPALVINLEGGLLSVASRGDIDYVEAESAEHVENIILAFKNRSEEVAQYKTVIVDSATELATKILSEWITRNIERAQRQNKRKDHTPDDVQREDYGAATLQAARLFRWMRDLPVHTLMTGLTKKVVGVDNESIAHSAFPNFTNKLGVSVVGYMDEVWYYYLDGNDNRCLLTRTSGAYYAKTRGQFFAERVGQVITNPYLPDIYQTLLDTESLGAGSRQLGAEQSSTGEGSDEELALDADTESASDREPALAGTA